MRVLPNVKAILSNLDSNKRYRVSYIGESVNWVTQDVAGFITANLNRLGLVRTRVAATHLGLRNQIIHYGFPYPLGLTVFGRPHPSNKIILTYYHIIPKDPRLDVLKSTALIDKIQTACSRTKRDLADIGIPEEKIVVIPLGVDTSLFYVPSSEEKTSLRRRFEIPQDRIVIGSFQKDGMGWEKGAEPKWVKGPDLFIEAVEQLSKKYPVYALLAGPARGYVAKGLTDLGIPFKSMGLVSRQDVARAYRTLDLYLITSRIEGGPRQILEAWASGVPVVSTKVGMVPDIASDGNNVLSADVENVPEIVKQAEKFITDGPLRIRVIKNALEEVKKYTWELNAIRHYDEIYSKV